MESAKSRVCVLACSRAWRVCVLTCLRVYVLARLRSYVLGVLACLCACMRVLPMMRAWCVYH